VAAAPKLTLLAATVSVAALVASHTPGPADLVRETASQPPARRARVALVTGGGSGGSTGIGGNDGGGCQAGANGNDGIGGAGGFVPGFGTAYWAQGTPVVATNVGQGGQNCHGSQASYSTPSGGGGYGGGGAGGWLSGPDIAGGGGGGGGSFAAQSTLDNIDPSQWSRSAGGGWIYILFGPQP
jgi:hypothetical protein